MNNEQVVQPESAQSQTPSFAEMSLADYRASRETPVAAPEVKEPATDEQAPDAGAPDADAEGGDEQDTETEREQGEDAQPEKGKKKGGWQRKIEKIERENADLKAKLAESKPAAAAPEAPAIEEPKPADFSKPKPKLEDFESLEAFTDAVTDWKFDKREFDSVEKSKVEESKKARESAASEAKTLNERWQQGQADAKGKHTDYDAVLAEVADVKLSAAHQRVFLESEHGPELAYALAQDRTALERIAKLSPLSAAREIGKLEDKLFPDTTPKEEPKVSSAPRPIKPVSGGNAVAATKADPAKMSLGDYRKARETGRLR